MPLHPMVQVGVVWQFLPTMRWSVRQQSPAHQPKRVDLGRRRWQVIAIDVDVTSSRVAVSVDVLF